VFTIRAACREPLALPPYTKMAASSVRHSRHGNKTRARRSGGSRLLDSCRPQDAFVVSNKAWCARKNNGLYIYSRESEGLCFTGVGLSVCLSVCLFVCLLPR